MKTVKISVFVIGVALSVIPIFNSALAQSGSDSTAVMLRLQDLQVEIGELRDMVERQQFELKKLKQTLATQQAAVAQPGAQSYGQRPQVLNGQTVLDEYGNVTQAQQEASVAGDASRYPNQTPVFTQPQTQNPSPSGTDTRQNWLEPSQFEAVSGTTAANTTINNNPNSDKPNSWGLDSATNNDINADNGVSNRSNSNPNLSNGVENGVEVIERGIEDYSGADRAPVLGTGQRIQGNPTNSAQGAALPKSVNRPILSVPNTVPTQQGAINANEFREPSNQQSAAEQSAASRGAVVASQTEQASRNAPQFSEDNYYDRGFEFLKQSKYDEAVTVFQQQIRDYPQGDLADDAHYWVAEAMFINRKPTEAKPYLRAIIDSYPQSARLPDAMLKMAYIEQDLGNVIEARILLQEIVAQHPSSNAAIAAKNRLENLKVTN